MGISLHYIASRCDCQRGWSSKWPGEMIIAVACRQVLGILPPPPPHSNMHIPPGTSATILQRMYTRQVVFLHTSIKEILLALPAASLEWIHRRRGTLLRYILSSHVRTILSYEDTRGLSRHSTLCVCLVCMCIIFIVGLFTSILCRDTTWIR